MNNINLLSEILQYRTYAKTLPSGRKETRSETINRSMNMYLDKYPEHKEIIEEAFAYVHSGKVVGSMRAMQFAGEAIDQSNARMFNCSATTIQTMRDFADIFYLLMCGSGVGFSVQGHHISSLPVIEYKLGEGVKFQVEDTKESWCEALHQLLEMPSLEFDYSKIRPKGSPMSSGGTSSGSGALLTTIEKVREILKKAEGRKLRAIEVFDIVNFIADGVAVGGSRRSALLCMFDSNDTEMLTAKHDMWWVDNPQRARSNISAVIKRSATDAEAQMSQALNMMYKSGSGEPGVLQQNDTNYLKNPCVTGDTPILTSDGYIPIAELEGQPTKVWNGFEFSEVVPAVTGTNQKIMEVSFSNGRTLKCTPYHKFHLSRGYQGQKEIVEAKDLKIGEKLIKCDFPIITHGREDNYRDMYTRGFHAADGDTGGKELRLYDGKMKLLSHLNATSNGRVFTNKIGSTEFINARVKCQLFGKNFVPTEYGLPERLAWFAGFIDGDGCELPEGGLQVSSVNVEFLQDIQLMLQTCGVDSKIVHRQNAGMRLLPDGNGGQKEYWCKEAKAICISAYQMQRLKAAGMRTNRLQFHKSPNRDASRFVQVTGIKELEGTEDFVYCFEEPKNNTGIFNGIITGQCVEISLKDPGLCNLTEINAAACVDVADFNKAVWAATILGTLQASYTDFNFLQDKWKESADEEALLGVSITGQAANWKLVEEATRGGAAAQIAVDTNKLMAKLIGINPAKRITTTKPSGSTSLWLGTTSGIHAAHSEFYIRRIRVDKANPIVKGLLGYPYVEEDLMNPSNVIVAVPVSMKGAITRSSESSIDLMERAAYIYDNWVKPGHIEGPDSHNVSLTVSYKEEEWEDVKHWMLENKERYSGISLLPYSDHTYRQAPFEEITEDVYNLLMKGISYVPDFTKIDFTGTVDERIAEVACAGGQCEIT